MARTFGIAPGEIYHLYNRGIEKRVIFLCRRDYERFIVLLYFANQTEAADLKYQGRSFREIHEDRCGEPIIDILAYCLMPNHFHLLVRERVEGGIARFMQKLTTGYTMYFNKRNDRSGALLQGTYKAVHVDTDQYFRYLVSYIHLNPIKLIEPEWKEIGIKNHHAAQKYLKHYLYSSYLDYLGNKRPEEKLLHKDVMEEIFPLVNDFESCVTEWLTYDPDFDKV